MTYFERKSLKGRSMAGKDSDGSTEIIFSIIYVMEVRK